MDQSLTYRLLFGVMGSLITIFIYYDSRKSNLSVLAKFGFFIVVLFFLQLILRCVMLLFFYILIPGTTLGTYNPIKQTSTKVKYEYSYNGKLYSSSEYMEENVIAKGGRYYVRVSKFVPSINEIDFSMPVLKN